MDQETRNYVDLKTEATRAQNDARFTQLLVKLDHVPTSDSMRNWIIGAVAAIIGTGLAVLQFGGDRFDGGMGAASVSLQDAIQARETARQNAARMDEVDKKLDVLIQLLGEKAKQ